MKKAKRAISILMCAALLLGLLPAVALAADSFSAGIRLNAHDVDVTPTNLTAGQTDAGWTPYTFVESTSATLTFDTTNQNYHGIMVRSYGASDDHDDATWNCLKLKSGIYEITDTTKFYEIEVIDRQQSVYDNEFVVDYDPSNDFTVKVDSTELTPRETVTAFTKDDELTFTASDAPYKVLVRTNGAPDAQELTLTPDSKTFTYTPTSDAGFELRVYRNEEEYEFDTIPCNWDTQFIAEYQVRFDGCKPNEGCAVTYEVEPAEVKSYDGRTRLVLNKGTTTVNLTISTAENYIYEVWVHGNDGPERVDNGVYTWTTWTESGNSDIRPEIVFRSESTDPGEGGGGNAATAQTLATAIEQYIFAYGVGATGDICDTLKNKIASELSQRRIGGLNASLGEFMELDMSEAQLSTSISTIAGKISFDEADPTQNGVLADRDCYTFMITLQEANIENGTGEVSATGKVYVLDNETDIVVKTTKNNVAAYSVVTLSGNENATTSVYVDGEFDEVYGNGAWLNGISSEDTNIQVFHITQEHAGTLNSFPMGSKLLVGTTSKAVSLAYGKDAAAWGFSNANAYSVGTVDAPTRASVFYGAGSITLGAVDFANRDNEPTITGIEVLNLPASAVGIAGSTITFLTNYDYIKLKITYSDSFGYLDIVRVGLTIDGHDVQNAPGGTTWNGAKTFNVWHGTDQSVRYQADNGAGKVITATFYYDDNTEISRSEGTWDSFDQAVLQKYETLTRMDLFVTITYTDGTRKSNIVNASAAITRGEKAVAVDNGEFNKSDDTTTGYAGQGTCHFYDDYVLWSGSEAEYGKIKSISAIVYTGDASSLGGVKVGSGTGVTWTNEAH